MKLKNKVCLITGSSRGIGKAIALGLGMVIPGAGSLFGAYKNSTAMGYSINNPFSGFFTFFI